MIYSSIVEECCDCMTITARAGGTIQLQDFVKEFTKKVYTPAYSDWTTLSHCGNSDGLAFHSISNYNN